MYRQLHTFLSSSIKDRGDEGVVAEDGTEVTTGQEGRLTAETEMKFLLFRHWSLYDAMYYSPYVASRIPVWKANGKNKLHELLAKMGISLEQCKQKWTFMPHELRQRVEDQLEVRLLWFLLLFVFCLLSSALWRCPPTL